MRYVIVETKFGFFGILAHKGTILRTSLPVSTPQLAEIDLLGDLEGVGFNANLLPNLQRQIKSYFAGTHVEFNNNITLNLDTLSKFSQDILKACIKIPYGKTVSYAELAKIANHPKAARAVVLIPTQML